MKNQHYDICIVGGGIVGLATAYTILQKKPELRLLLLEKENTVAKHQTGNNSGVIHSGIYYKPGSLKAKNCLRGYSLLLDFCKSNNIHHKLCGKVIVATEERELPLLERLFDRGKANGLDKIEIIDEKAIRKIEPEAAGIRGIYVPYTGVVDYKIVCAELLKHIQEAGAKVVFNTELTGIKNNGSIILETTTGNYSAEKLITCCGLHSDKVAQMTHGETGYRILPFRGEYYKLSSEKAKKINTLIYPVPDPDLPFLGVHLTKSVDGEVEAGPNAVLALKKEGYNKTDFALTDIIEILKFRGFRKMIPGYFKIGVSEYKRSLSKSLFLRDLRKLVPMLEMQDLVTGGAGVRAQACSVDGKLVDDFLFIEDDNVIHVCNAPSPAATASLAIGESIAEKYFSKL